MVDGPQGAGRPVSETSVAHRPRHCRAETFEGPPLRLTMRTSCISTTRKDVFISIRREDTSNGSEEGTNNQSGSKEELRKEESSEEKSRQESLGEEDRVPEDVACSVQELHLQHRALKG